MPVNRIKKLLVANRGEIASRILRTAHEMDIATVAVFSDPDAETPFVDEADEAVRLPGATPAETYLRLDAILDAARRTGADAVHPGYGFLSENAGFARACAHAGLVFVGPPPEAIEAMGSKTQAKTLMAQAGVPVLAGLVVDDELAADPARLVQATASLEFPLLVKAVYGGGGRGMRIVREPAGLATAVAGARREAAAAFGDGAVFLETYVERPRHIEVQIFGDAFGDVVHLFERECSVQRRFQKIIEEAPSVAVDDELRGSLGSAAIAAAKAIGYVGAGTVEFVLDPRGRFFFLEVNTRLQVEHPVTEEITGLDLVRAQLRVAEGEPLPDELRAARIDGHAIEARLYAEDVAAGFLPAIGTVHRFDVPALAGIRVDRGVADGSVVGVHYDAMLAKVIAHGATRDQAIRRLARALDRTRVHGLTTNRSLLVAILRDERFRSGQVDTGYLDGLDLTALGSSGLPDAVVATHLLAATLAGVERRRAAAVLPTAPAGWRNVAVVPQRVAFEVDGRQIEVLYRRRADRIEATVDGRDYEVLAHRTEAEMVDLTVAGIRATVHLTHAADGWWYADGRGGSTAAREVPRFVEPGAAEAPGSLAAPMPGVVVRLAVAVGDRVTAGDPILVLEAMKMEHTVRTPVDGVVTEISAGPGDTVDSGHILAIVTADGTA
ncbi:biotin carboxylase N-terminal domain-containing protein [Pseudofrankia sp. BMG5.36]|uniref:ATP-binding protein n=1 Tax=Pseudofrankia sp. BMG5.36 TaxID=1834512 RepID=UPI0008D8DB26|nr:biotin carboxylase N-terminal domain-containing protein [Pseudofrankia sp. BMG5.36]OHV42674.1 acetyl/propionyl-CoA carboxylase subuit alpha [Pseudofrankia sp. BMG5.36]